MQNKGARRRAVVAGVVVAALAVGGSIATATGEFRTTSGPTVAAAVAVGSGPTTVAAGSNPVYFVHGYNGRNATDCHRAWNNALTYFRARGWRPADLKTVGYYRGDRNCDVRIGTFTTSDRIYSVAASLAWRIYNRHTRHGRSVDLVAHSMGGLVARVALLGSAKAWKGFPKHKLLVGDLVTLGTPHQGVTRGRGTTQWDAMRRGSPFMRQLHRRGHRVGEAWSRGTDWTFVGSREDPVVTGASGVDDGYRADHKFRYLKGNAHPVTHRGIRELYGWTYRLAWWHASDGRTHSTAKGWAPLEAAYNAVALNRKW